MTLKWELLKQPGATVKPAYERFWAKVDIRGESDCWEWQGCTSIKGYGSFYLSEGKTISAHRFSLMQYGGFISDNTLHKCDNRRCVNPLHLFDGTTKENNQDMMTKGRDKCVGIRNPNAKATEQIMQHGLGMGNYMPLDYNRSYFMRTK